MTKQLEIVKFIESGDSVSLENAFMSSMKERIAEKMVALVLRTASLTQAAEALSSGAVPFAESRGRLLVPPASACGLVLGFTL